MLRRIKRLLPEHQRWWEDGESGEGEDNAAMANMKKLKELQKEQKVYTSEREIIDSSRALHSNVYTSLVLNSLSPLYIDPRGPYMLI